LFNHKELEISGIQIQTKLDQPSRQNGQLQTSEARLQLQT